MNILQVTNFYKPSWETGGVTRVCYEISQNLMRRGHEVTVYTTDGFKFRLAVKKNNPVNIDGIVTYYFRNLSTYLSREFIFPIPYYLPIVARKEIKNFDVIHIHEHRTFFAIVVHYYAMKNNIPYIIQAHGSVLPLFRKQRFKYIFDTFVGYKILKDASKVIALTRIEAEQYKNMYVSENQIEIVPNGIDLSEYENLPKRGRFRSKLGIRNSTKVVLYLGRINRIKGIDLLIEAFSHVIGMVKDVILVIAGPDDGFLSTIKLQIENLKIGDKIIFTGPLYGTDKLEAYVDADVYVLPSIYETFPVTVLEACACGTPIVVTNRCGIADVIDKEVGCIVEWDVIQLRNTIINILNDDELRIKFGNNGRKIIKDHFDSANMINHMEKIYEEVRGRTQ